ncbi:RNA polymerase sigma factor [Niallia sp. NCCP-28]|uniref:RNA polymerase sigma factor n=1 Tax=Niallia sp. NCCP-28 TaxID=2934712 RepID=UPI00208793B6|nr:sigma-70 family RNA polymerase sigma factor [Niallia sp. NCCP-28]GKU84435.1 RNA polymerase subunit sigma [Niallia sp. NCCP-28]
MNPLCENEFSDENRPLKYESIVKEYGKSIFHYIFSLVKHKELAEDIYQEVLISAYIAYPNFEDNKKIKSWLYTIAINKCRDYWRKEKRKNKFWEESVYTYVRNSADSMPPPEEIIINQCSKEEMIDTLEELPIMYKEPLMLFYYHNQTLVEISDKTKLPLSTVKTRMKRAKDKLKPKMASKLVNI